MGAYLAASGEPQFSSRGKESSPKGQMGKKAGPKKDVLNQQRMEGIKLDKLQLPIVLQKREQMSLWAIDLTTRR